MKISKVLESMYGKWIPCTKVLPPKNHGVPILADVGDSGDHFPMVLQWNKNEKQWECDLGDASVPMEEIAITAWMPIVYPDDFDSMIKD